MSDEWRVASSCVNSRARVAPYDEVRFLERICVESMAAGIGVCVCVCGGGGGWEGWCVAGTTTRTRGGVIGDARGEGRERHASDG